MNFLTLSALVHNEESAIAFLQQRGILHAQRLCANGHEMTLSLGNYSRWRCSKRECRKEVGLRVGTWLAHSNLTLRQVVLFIYCWSKKRTTIKFCEEELGISHDGTVNWNSLLREVCAWRVSQTQGAIGGPGMTVEIDEALFSKRKNHAGRVLPQQWVFGGICRETGQSFMVPVPNRSAATLMPIIREKIRLGTTIMSDEWRAYRVIQGAGYEHLTVNHRHNFVNPITGAHTQNIERSWRSAKERNKRQCGTSRGQLESYLDTFMWETRLDQRDPFDVILEDIAAFMPPQD